MWGFLIIAVILVFATTIVKMGLEYSERVERMKHGYPLDDKKDIVIKSKDGEFIDARGDEKLQ